MEIFVLLAFRGHLEVQPGLLRVLRSPRPGARETEMSGGCGQGLVLPSPAWLSWALRWGDRASPRSLSNKRSDV